MKKSLKFILLFCIISASSFVISPGSSKPLDDLTITTSVNNIAESNQTVNVINEFIAAYLSYPQNFGFIQYSYNITFGVENSEEFIEIAEGTYQIYSTWGGSRTSFLNISEYSIEEIPSGFYVINFSLNFTNVNDFLYIERIHHVYVYRDVEQPQLSLILDPIDYDRVGINISWEERLGFSHALPDGGYSLVGMVQFELAYSDISFEEIDNRAVTEDNTTEDHIKSHVFLKYESEIFSNSCYVLLELPSIGPSEEKSFFFKVRIQDYSNEYGEYSAVSNITLSQSSGNFPLGLKLSSSKLITLIWPCGSTTCVNQRSHYMKFYLEVVGLNDTHFDLKLTGSGVTGGHANITIEGKLYQVFFNQLVSIAGEPSDKELSVVFYAEYRYKYCESPFGLSCSSTGYKTDKQTWSEGFAIQRDTPPVVFTIDINTETQQLEIEIQHNNFIRDEYSFLIAYGKSVFSSREIRYKFSLADGDKFYVNYTSLGIMKFEFTYMNINGIETSRGSKQTVYIPEYMAIAPLMGFGLGAGAIVGIIFLIKRRK